jgi:DhnA family fructose-bisphosphate aldolase class Ia
MRLSHPFLLAWLNVVFLLSFASTALGKPIKPDSSIFADLVLVNGVVASIDEAIVGAQAIAVSGHLIMGVGSDEEMSVFISELSQRAVRIDLLCAGGWSMRSI